MGLTKRLAFAAHRAAAKLGLHVLPRHYYSSVVDPHELAATRARWAKPSTLPGVAWDADAQVACIRTICAPHRAEYAENRVYREAVAGSFGPGYGAVEAQALHAVVRHFQPRRIVEVGSGVSTVCLRAAADDNARDGAAEASLTCIEPFPSAALRAQRGIELIAKPVQDAPLPLFEALGDGDLLFIDSSHQAKTGSDVTHLFLEVLPRLQPGVVVHIHDIYLPYDYAPFTMKTLWHWNETAFLHAYLIHNEHMRVLFCMSLLHHERRDVLAELFPGYDPEPLQDGLLSDAAGALDYPSRHFPAAIFLRTQ